MSVHPRVTFVVLLSAFCCRAERLFVGILEADSIQSIHYGAAAFSRVSDLTLVQQQVQARLAQALLLPEQTGIAMSGPLKIVQSVDSDVPPAPDNPATVAIIPLADDGTMIRQAYATTYAQHKTQGDFTLYEAPTDTNRAPFVAVAVADRHLFTSLSLSALTWAWQHRSKFLEAPAQSLPGTVRVLVNPQRMADLVGTRSAQAAGIVDLDHLLRDCETCSFSFTLEGAVLGLSLRATAKQGSALDALLSSWRLPSEMLWHAVPDNAFYMSLGAVDRPDLWTPFLGTLRHRLLTPISDRLSSQTTTGDRLDYIVSTRNGKGLCWVQLQPVKDSVAAQVAIRALADADSTNSVSFKHLNQRTAGGTAIETYAITLKPAEPMQATASGAADPSLSHMLLSLLLKRAVLECAVHNGHCITVIGPEGAIDEQLPPASFTVRPLPLNRRIGVQDPALNPELTFGGCLRAAELIRHTVTIMPEIKPEQARLLPRGGDGMTFGIVRNERTLTASLRIQSNEIAALQRLNRDGRAVLQEVFFQILAKQMMEREKPPEKK
ncbi:MAG TPA: hypothetical protein P5026_10265 [Kiritimatiellia bacterium]|nr:hypothetical protein [Kiritimatiellia bacterium]HRU71131.1 hypothetical protein [Kiritimatiellia bacterium]